MEKPVRKVDFLEEKGTKRTEAIIKQAQKSAKSEKIKNRNIKNTKKLLIAYCDAFQFTYKTYLSTKIVQIHIPDKSKSYKEILLVLEKTLEMYITDINYILDTRHLRPEYPKLIKQLKQNVVEEFEINKELLKPGQVTIH